VCPRCNKECLTRRYVPPCDVDMGEHDEIDADTIMLIIIYIVIAY